MECQGDREEERIVTIPDDHSRNTSPQSGARDELDGGRWLALEKGTLYGHQYREDCLWPDTGFLNDCVGSHTHVCAQGAALEVTGDLAAELQRPVKL